MDIPEVLCNQHSSLIFFFFSDSNLEFKHSNKAFDMGRQHILALEIISVVSAEVTTLEPSHRLTRDSILSMCGAESAWLITKWPWPLPH